MGEAKAALVKAVMASVDWGWEGSVARGGVAEKSPATVPAGTGAGAEARVVATKAWATVVTVAGVVARVVASWVAAGVVMAARAVVPTAASLAVFVAAVKAEVVMVPRLGSSSQPHSTSGSLARRRTMRVIQRMLDR